MGKTVKKIATIAVGIGLVIATGGTLAAPTLFGSTFFGSLAVSAGFGLALSGAVGLVFGDPSTPQTLGTRLTLQANPTAPRTICYGKAAMAGTLVFRDVVGNNNKDLWLVIALAGHEINSIESFTWGGEAVTFASNNAVGDLNNLMFRYDKLGLDAQTVETNLDTASSKWTSAHRLRGLAYIVLKLVYDQEKNNQIKNPVCTIKGRRLYDPRLDSTNGGSGSHRLADQSTWAWSDNPVLAIADYLTGIRVANSSTSSYDGQIIAGVGVNSTRIDWANIIAEANACDESVNLNGGGSESRYTCNGFIDPQRSHAQNLEALASSMGGTVVFQGGKWRIYAAVTRAAVKSRSEADMLSGIEYRSKKSRSEKANAVRGVYADVTAEFQPRDIVPLINATYVTEDGGDELWMDVNLPMTTSATMAQRLAKIALERSRMDKMVSASFGPIALQDQAMDSITFSYVPLGLTDQKMRVADWQMQVANDENGNSGLVFPMTLIEEADAIYAWNETTDEQPIPASVTVTRVERISGVSAPNLAMKINVDADGAANVGEAALIGIDGNGTPDFGADGFVYWNGAKITVARVQGANVSIATALAGIKSFICFETALDTPFTVASVPFDIAIVHKVGSQWKYDDNSATPVNFTPTSTMVALGWMETSTADLISNAGLFGAPVSLELAAFPTATEGATWGVNIDGSGMPADNADVTGSNTAADTALVGGTAAATVRDGSVRANLGLDGSGDLARNLLSARADSSNLLRRSAGGLYTGALAATLGATWGVNIDGDAKPADYATGGSSLVRGTAFNTLSEWFANNPATTILASPWSVVTGVSGPVGNNALQIIDNNDDTNNIFSERVPLDPSKTYRVSVHARQPSGDRRNYLLVSFYEADGTLIQGSGGGTTGWAALGTYHYWQVANAAFPTGWTSYSFTFGPGKNADANIPTGAAFVQIGGLFARAGPVGTNSTVQIQGLRIDEVSPALLVGGDIASGIGMDQGDGVIRNLPFGPTYISGRDGDARTYVNPYSSEPSVEFIRGGGTFDGGGLSNTVVHQNAIKAISITASGFTIQAKLKETASSITNETDGDGTGAEVAWHSGNGPTDPDWQAGKENTAEAHNDQYEWEYDISGSGEVITIGFYINTGSGWVKQGSNAVHFNAVSGAKVTRTIDGLTTNSGGEEYGVEVESPGPGMSLADVVAVRWESATAPSTVTATPTGADDVVFRVEGNIE